MSFTAAQRAKAIATRQENARLRRLEREKEQPTNGHAQDKNVHWRTAPLDELMQEFSALTKDYEEIRGILVSRQAQPKMLKCWSVLNKDKVSVQTLADCAKNIPDGRWVFKDDGYRNSQGMIESQYCCSQRCYMAYTQNKPRAALSRS
jgi:hypothetical protein